MAVDNKGARGTDGGTSETTGTEETQETETTGGGEGKGVPHETHKKLLSEKKAETTKRKELEARIAELENSKLEAEGKKDELIAKLRKDLDGVSTKHKETLNGFISQSLNSQVESLATKMGAVDTDAVSKLLDLSDVEVDPKTFKADQDSLETAIGELKKAKPYLFNKAAPKVNSKMPTGNVKTVNGKALKDMTSAELTEALRSLK